jgi:hypothetical protein
VLVTRQCKDLLGKCASYHFKQAYEHSACFLIPLSVAYSCTWLTKSAEAKEMVGSGTWHVASLHDQCPRGCSCTIVNARSLVSDPFPSAHTQKQYSSRDACDRKQSQGSTVRLHCPFAHVISRLTASLRREGMRKKHINIEASFAPHLRSSA